jgi:hypothetical protein
MLGLYFVFPASVPAISPIILFQPVQIIYSHFRIYVVASLIDLYISCRITVYDEITMNVPSGVLQLPRAQGAAASGFAAEDFNLPLPQSAFHTISVERLVRAERLHTRVVRDF